MPLRANCPDCRTVLAIADQAAGKRVLCPKCRTEFPAPVAEDPKPLERIAATLAAAPALSGSHAEAEPTLVEPAETTQAAPLRRTAPAKKRSFALVLCVVLLALFLFCGGFGLLGYWISRTNSTELTQEKQKPAAPDPAPPPSDPVTIQPPPLKGTTTYKLPDAVDDLAVGGGGRFLILHFPKLHKLGVFDANEAKITHYVSAAEDRVRLTAGMSKLLVYAPNSGVLQRWDLLTGEREKLGKLAGASGQLSGFCMGSASTGPLLVALHGQPPHLFDINTFEQLPDPEGGMTGQLLASGAYQASANGRLFTHTGGAILLEGGRAQHFSTRRGAWFVLPGPDGKYVYLGGAGIYTNRLTSTGDAVYSPSDGSDHIGHSYLPAEHGPYYMHLHLASTPARGLPHNPDDPQYGITIYTLGERRPLAQMADLGMVTSDTIQELKGMGFEKTVHLIPRAHLLVVLPVSRDKLMLHPIDLEKKLDKAGIKYLLVTSEPPTAARRGQTLTYAITARSNAGGITFQLDSGPDGMTVAPDGRLSWNVPGDFADKQADVIVRIQDADKQERFHTFTIQVGDR